MYEVLAGNRVRKMPEWTMKTSSYQGEGLMTFDSERDAYNKFHELVKYDGQLQSKVWEPVKKENGEVYPISGSHNWKEGQLIEEGKDFKLEESLTDISFSVNGGEPKPHSKNILMKYAIPIPSVDKEDEVWVELVTEIDRFKDSELLYKYLKQSFTISRKPSSSSLHH